MFCQKKTFLRCFLAFYDCKLEFIRGIFETHANGVRYFPLAKMVRTCYEQDTKCYREEGEG